MGVYALTGNDDLFLFGRTFKNFSDSTTIQITFPNEKVGTSTGKNGNTVFSTNTQGKNVQVDLRLIVGSDEDIFLNGLSIQQDNDLPSFVLGNGTFSKRVGDGFGKVRRVNYVLQGGVFRQDVDGQENLQGDTEQGTALYRLTFAYGRRTII